MRHSHSSIQTYRACPLKYKLHYVDHLVPLQLAGRHDLDFSLAWHAALQTWYRTGSVSDARTTFATAYPPDQYPEPLPLWSQGKSFENGLAAVSAYGDRWLDDDQFWEVLSIEQKETGEDDDRTLKLDLVVRDSRDGLVYGIDHKGTGQYLDSKFWASFEPDSQVRFYADHINRKYGHCGGFIINAASFKHRSKAYTPRTGPDKGVQLPAGDWFRLERFTINPNEACLQLERDNFAYWTQKIEIDKTTGQYGYNTESCMRYGRPCEFLQICSPGYSWPNDQELITSYYRQCCPRVLPEGRCTRDLDHDGDCVVERPAPVTEDFTVEEDVEEAVV